MMAALSARSRRRLPTRTRLVKYTNARVFFLFPLDKADQPHNLLLLQAAPVRPASPRSPARDMEKLRLWLLPREL